ncbi:hypothetical protein GCM10007880_67750 [Mesorhizobium amorphae]|nr:hypothetical protein GCM10007880_67750 [Mesorhizobium amorphae]
MERVAPATTGTRNEIMQSLPLGSMKAPQQQDAGLLPDQDRLCRWVGIEGRGACAPDYTGSQDQQEAYDPQRHSVVAIR